MKQLVRFQNTDGDVWRVEATGLPRGRQRFVIGQVFEYGFQFETPKALANLSPGLERSDNPGLARKIFRQTLLFDQFPGLERSDNPGLWLANAFGV